MEWTEIKQKLIYGDQKQVAEILGVTQQGVNTIIKRESGTMEIPVKDALAAIIIERENRRKKMQKIFQQPINQH